MNKFPKMKVHWWTYNQMSVCFIFNQYRIWIRIDIGY